MDLQNADDFSKVAEHMRQMQLREEKYMREQAPQLREEEEGTDKFWQDHRDRLEGRMPQPSKKELEMMRQMKERQEILSQLKELRERKPSAMDYFEHLRFLPVRREMNDATDQEMQLNLIRTPATEAAIRAKWERQAATRGLWDRPVDLTDAILPDVVKMNFEYAGTAEDPEVLE